MKILKNGLMRRLLLDPVERIGETPKIVLQCLLVGLAIVIGLIAVIVVL